MRLRTPRKYVCRRTTLTLGQVLRVQADIWDPDLSFDSGFKSARAVAWRTAVPNIVLNMRTPKNLEKQVFWCAKAPSAFYVGFFAVVNSNMI